MADKKWRYSATLIRSGKLTEVDPMIYTNWVGATATIKFFTVATDTLIREAAVTLTLPSAQGVAARYRYVQAPELLPVAKYWYEVRVQFLDTTVLVWPSDRAKRKPLEITL